MLEYVREFGFHPVHEKDHTKELDVILSLNKITWQSFEFTVSKIGYFVKFRCVCLTLKEITPKSLSVALPPAKDYRI